MLTDSFWKIVLVVMLWTFAAAAAYTYQYLLFMGSRSLIQDKIFMLVMQMRCLICTCMRVH